MTMPWVSSSEPVRLLLELLIKSTAVLSFGILLAFLLRKRSASLRHFVLTFFLVGLLLLPALTRVEFGWRTGLLPAPAAEAVRNGQTGGEAAIDGGAGELGSRFRLGGTDSPPASKDGRARDGSSGIAAVAPESATLEATPSSPRGSVLPRALQISVALLWAMGLAVILARLVLGFHGAYRLTREGDWVRDPAWRILLDRFLTLLGLRRPVRLKSHAEVAVPLTWGFVRPVILIPAGHEAWTEGQRSSALLHELSHIKRADFLVMVLVRLSLAVFWWNPLAWAVTGMLKKEQEKACDELVLRTGLKPSTYAANLLLFRNAAGLRWDPSAAFLGLFGRASLNERLAAILRQKLILKEVGMKTKILLAMITVLAVAAVGIARPGASPAPTSDVSTLTGAVALGLIEDPVPAVNQAPGAVPAEAVASGMLQADAQAADVAPAQEKEKQEKEKAEQEEVRTIVITSKDGKKIPIEITIVGADSEKTIKVDKSVVLKRGDKGEFILLGPDGKEIEVLKGEPIRIQIKDADIQVLGGDKALKITEGGSLKLVMEEDKGRIGWVIKEGEEGKEVTYRLLPQGELKGGSFYISGGAIGYVRKDDESGEVHITIGTKKDGKEITWVSKSDIEPRAFLVSEVKAEPHVTIVGKGDAKPFVTVKTVTDVKPEIAWTVKEDEQELRKQLEELRATLEKVKAKELDLSALEKALDKMEAELKEREEDLKTVAVRIREKPVNYSVVRRTDVPKSEVALWIGEGEAPRAVTITTGKKGDFSMAIAASGSEISREAYERIVESVRKELPEGYELESDFDSDVKGKAGVITLKIKGPDDKSGVATEVAKKLAEALKSAIKREVSAKK